MTGHVAATRLDGYHHDLGRVLEPATQCPSGYVQQALPVHAMTG